MSGKDKINKLRGILENMVEARAQELNARKIFEAKENYSTFEESESSFNEKVEKYIKSRKNK